MIDLSSKNAWLRPFKNAKKLLFGRTANALISIGVVGLSTRALGVEGFGVLTLIASSVATISTFFGFHSWQALMRYGAKALSKNNWKLFKKYIFFSIKLELLSAFIGIAFIAVFGDMLLSLFKIEENYEFIFILYALTLLFSAPGTTCNGILKLLDRHDIIAWHMSIGPFFKLIGTMFAFIYECDVSTFITVWIIANLASQFALFYLANHAYHKKKQEHPPIKNQSQPPEGPLGAPEQGIWSYIWGCNAYMSVVLDVAPMVTASVLGPEGAGLLRIAQKVGALVSYPVDKFISPVIHTDLAWLSTSTNWAKKKEFLIKTALVTTGFAFFMIGIMAVFGKEIIILIAGKEFISAHHAALFWATSMAINAALFGLSPFLTSEGKAWSITGIQLIGQIIFVGSLLYFTTLWGVTGAGAAKLLRDIVTAFLLILLVIKTFKVESTAK